MNDILSLAPWLLAMAVLIACSCFFSASEAALFYLRPNDRRSLKKGTNSERAAYQLLGDPGSLVVSRLVLEFGDQHYLFRDQFYRGNSY